MPHDLHLLALHSHEQQFSQDILTLRAAALGSGSSLPDEVSEDWINVRTSLLFPGNLSAPESCGAGTVMPSASPVIAIQKS